MKEDDINGLMDRLKAGGGLDESIIHRLDLLSRMNDNGELDAMLVEMESESSDLAELDEDEELDAMITELEASQNGLAVDDEKFDATLTKMDSQRKGKKNIFSTVKEYGGKRKQPKPIVELEAGEALDFLMESEQYCRTELPRYFDFSGVLEYAKKSVGDKSLRECTVKSISPAELEGVNLEMMTNKDGRYGVRPLTLANPFLYYMLARDICWDGAWKGIQQCFALFKDEHVSACAIPMVKQDDRPEAFRGSTAVLHWWNSMEQTSIEMSLRYRFMFVTDITNCFGQINPESIGWALSLKDTEHETDRNDRLAKDIMEYLRAMQHGRNMGIPQGSTLFSFIAEIILGYSDMLFVKAVREAQARKELPAELDYHVLRYVDDYRIFCSDREALDKLSYILQDVLEKFNFRMNSSKTKISSNIISDTVKPDKMFYIFNTPIESKQTYRGEGDELVRQHAYDFDGFQKHLLYIYEFSRNFPNAGQLKNQLSAFSRRLEDFLNGENTTVRSFSLDEEDENSKTAIKKKHLWENRPVMVAIAVQIAADNVASAHYALKVASQIMADMPDKESEKKLEIIRLIYDKLRNQPNSAFTQVWLQNITHTSDDWNGDKEPYDMPLCRIVAGKPEQLWNNSWLKKKIMADFPFDSIVDRKILEETGQVISFNERISYDELVSEL